MNVELQTTIAMRIQHRVPRAPTVGAEPTPWMADAVCASVDPELFYPDKGGNPASAKRVCTGCPVQTECLAFALEHGERFGIWGGTTERERRRMRTSRRVVHPIAHGTEGGYKTHLRRGETPCESCAKASRLATAERRESGAA